MPLSIPRCPRFTTHRDDSEEEAEDWRGKVLAFLNLYGFLSQVIPYQGLRSRAAVRVPAPSRGEIAASQEWPGVPVR